MRSKNTKPDLVSTLETGKLLIVNSKRSLKKGVLTLKT